MKLLKVFSCLLFLNIPFADLLTLDPAASSLLEHYIKNKDVVISLKHIRPRRKLSISTEALFVIDLPKIKHKISFFLNRLEHLVTMDISSNSLTVSKSFLLPYNNDSSTIRSLAIAFHGKQISLYIECNEVSVHTVEKGLSQLYLQSDTPSIKLFRERKYPLYFDGSIDDALSRANCHKVNRKNGNKKLLRNKTHNKERNKRQDMKKKIKVSDMHLKQSDFESSKANPLIHDSCSSKLNDMSNQLKMVNEYLKQHNERIQKLESVLKQYENLAETKT